MADKPSKRPREETQIEETEETKRHKSYNQILSLLEEEEEEPTQDLTSLINTLQQELSYDPLANTTLVNDQDAHSTLITITDDYPSSSSSSSKEEEEEEGDRERVMRLLLEASDDELGIPNREDVGVVNSDEGLDFDGVEDLGEVDEFVVPNGLWDFEEINVKLL